VAAVQVVPTHVVRASDRQATSSNELHYSPHLRFPVSKKLVGKEKLRFIISLCECLYYLYPELGFGKTHKIPTMKFFAHSTFTIPLSDPGKSLVLQTKHLAAELSLEVSTF
jgi:hypothetical protein